MASDIRSVIECPICMVSMLRRSPRALPCLHTFCQLCLINYVRQQRKRTIMCPVCRKPTALPAEGVAGFPVNFLIEQISRKPDTKASAKAPVQMNAVCDRCRKRIIGTRYKCGNCQDYDLCEECEDLEGSEESIHPQDHVFIKIRRPTSYATYDATGRKNPLLARNIYQPPTVTEFDGAGNSKQEGKETQQVVTPQRETTRLDAICNWCHEDIIHVRYKCGNCENFDLCETCEAQEGRDGRAHDPDHVFVKIRRAAPMASFNLSGVREPLLLRNIFKEGPGDMRGLMGAFCDLCNEQIDGIRYKCGNCWDFDLCEACEMLADQGHRVHMEDHVFLKLRDLRPYISEIRPAPLLSRKVYR